MAVTVELQSSNQYDFSRAELEELASLLEYTFDRLGKSDSLTLKPVVKPAFGTGNAWYDSLWVWLPTAELIREHIYGPAMDTIVEYMKRRFRRRFEEKRPKKIILIYGPDNDVLREVTLDDPETVLENPDE